MSDDSNREILLFLTSTARPLYRRDLLNVCTDPEGANIRFAYNKNWISERARIRIVKDAEVLIVFCELVVRSLKYYPVRFAKVKSAELVKDSFSVDLELTKFFIPSGDGNENNKQNVEFQKSLNAIPNNPNNSIKEERRYVLTGTIANSLLPSSDNCLPLIEELKTLNGLKDCYFICGLPPIEFPPNFIKWIKRLFHYPPKPSPVFLSPQFCLPKHELRVEGNSYILKAGKNYRVTLLVIPGKNALDDKTPRLSIDETIPTLSVLGPFVKQNPFGFEAQFIVHCKHSLYRELGGFFLRIKNKGEIYKSSEIFGVIHVKRDKWFMAIFLLIPLSILCTFIGPDFIREFSDNSLNRSLCVTVPCITPYWFSLILKIIGIALSLLAAYILTGKITFK